MANLVLTCLAVSLETSFGFENLSKINFNAVEMEDLIGVGDQ